MTNLLNSLKRQRARQVFANQDCGNYRNVACHGALGDPGAFGIGMKTKCIKFGCNYESTGEEAHGTYRIL